jgi:hypothetical protein
MAIKVTGLFKNPQSGLIYENPTLMLIPHLEYANKINLEVFVNTQHYVNVINYPDLNKDSLVCDPSITNPYLQLINALETVVINDIQNANSMNQSATYTRV